jgi:hypothetical protein
VKVKGSALRARARWVHDRGDEAVARFEEALSPGTRAQARAGFLVHEWYEYETFIELNEVIDRLFGKGDYALCRELGRYACEVNLNTIYKLLIRFGSVNFILQRAATAWRVNYSEGTMEVLESTDQAARLRITGLTRPHRTHCLSVLGWVVRAAELSGATVVEEKETCRCLGDPECELWFRWR